MRFQFVPVVVGSVLIAAPGIGNAGLSDSIDALRQIATDVGRAIGATSSLEPADPSNTRAGLVGDGT
jgi:hypothetical protein